MINIRTMRIDQPTLIRAITDVGAMSDSAKETLAAQIQHEQPHLFGSCLVQARLGVPMEKLAFLLHLLFVCYQAMKLTGISWPVISEDELDRQLQRFAGLVKFSDGLSSDLRTTSASQFAADHPEPELLAYVQVETSAWLARVEHEDADKYLLLAAWNLVNCIAYVPLPVAAVPATPPVSYQH